MATPTPVSGPGRPLASVPSALEASEARYRRLFEVHACRTF